MTKTVAILSVTFTLLARVAFAEPEGKGKTAPASPPVEAPASSPEATEEARGDSEAWSPTATWRPAGSAGYDEDLALADLLNMSATVATKSSAAVSRSPGMVTVYGEQDVRRMGYYTLAGLADVTAGYSAYVIYGEKIFETRGQKAGSFNNNKHLVLIDGIPVNHGRGNKAMIDENFPLFFANRVEFLKGPASALYGTGAFFGVVNIAPKELEDRGFRAEWRAGWGTEQSDKRVAANAMYRDGVRHAAIYVGFFDKGPSGAFTGTANNPNDRFWDNQRSEFLYLTYGVDSGPLAGLKAGFIYASKNGGLGEHYIGGYSPDYDDLTWIQLIPYLKYERRLGSSFSFDAYFKASRDIEQGVAALASPSSNLTLFYKSPVSVYEALAELRWEPSLVWNVIAGVNVNINYQNGGDGTYGGKIGGDLGPGFKPTAGTLNGNDIFQTYSPFLQLSQTLPVLTALHVTAGARWDTGAALDAHFSQISPRVGVVQEFTDFLSLKLLYGTALRAPGNKELGQNNEARSELANQAEAAQVKPETIRSLEGGVALNTTHLSVNAAVFVNDTNGALDGRPAPGRDGNPKNIFTNTPGSIVARGTEVELTVAATAAARFFANYAFAKATLDPTALATLEQVARDSHDPAPTTAAQVADVPIHKVNAGASYRFYKPVDVTATLIGKWVSGYSGMTSVPETRFDKIRSQNEPDFGIIALARSRPDPAGHFVLDANVISRLSDHTSLELLVRNVFDATYQLPQAGLPYIPMPRRSFHLTLDYRW
jgi:outer membrane receptor for ferrienterochelin and colicins